MEDSKKTIHALASNYADMEKSIVNQLKINVPKHHPTTGTYREEIWKSLFEMIVSKKYKTEQSVFIIDSEGKISNEVDLVVFDEMYTPYIFKYEKIKFIPIEVVAIAIQCKSRVEKEETYDNIDKWVKSVAQLNTSLNSIARMQTMVLDTKNQQGSKAQTATRPIMILCATSSPFPNSLCKKRSISDYSASFKLGVGTTTPAFEFLD